MVFQPKFVKRDGDLYEIPDFLRERLRAEVRCVIPFYSTKWSSAISLATKDMKHGFVNYHGGNDGDPFNSFCAGTLDKMARNEDEAIDVRDRCETMLEVIGYNSGAPRSTCNGVHLTEVNEASILPAKNRAFETDVQGGNYGFVGKEERDRIIEEIRKKAAYFNKVLEQAKEEEKETANE